MAAIWTRSYWEVPVREVIPEQVTEAFHSARDFTTQTMEDSDFDFDTVRDQAASFYSSIVDSDSAQETEQEQTTPLELTTPEEQSFSIGNLELGDTKSAVIETFDSRRE